MRPELRMARAVDDARADGDELEQMLDHSSAIVDSILMLVRDDRIRDKTVLARLQECQ